MLYFLLFVGRALVTTIFVCLFITSIIVTIIYLKKKKSLICIVSGVTAVLMVFLLLNMYVFNQSFTPKFTVNNLSEVYNELKEIYVNTEENQTSYYDDYRKIYQYKNDKVELLLSLYDTTEDEDKRILDKYRTWDEYVFCGEKDGINYWCDELEPMSFSPYCLYFGIGGTIKLEKDNEILFIEYTLYDYKGFSRIIPVYPKEFKDVSFLIDLVKTTDE